MEPNASLWFAVPLGGSIALFFYLYKWRYSKFSNVLNRDLLDSPIHIFALPLGGIFFFLVLQVFSRQWHNIVVFTLYSVSIGLAARFGEKAGKKLTQ